MKIGLIDCDRKKDSAVFPNLALMKLSAWHKDRYDEVGWYDGSYCDRVYISKVFSFSENGAYEIINAGEVVRGGSGFAISVKNGREVYDSSMDNPLPYEVEHIYPDYGLYGITDTAYGYMSRGCPKGCNFCHVAAKEGRKSVKVADLSEFWYDQRVIRLLDPNVLACDEWLCIFNQLIRANALVDFTQGLDIRLIDEAKLYALKSIRTKHVHFAFDSMKDWNIITKNLMRVKREMGWNKNRVTVYCLTNFDTTIEDDLKRVIFLRDECGFAPYIMIYDKEHLPHGNDLYKLARWCNNPAFLWKYRTFEEYKEALREGDAR